MRFFLIFLAVLMPSAVQAADAVALSSTVFVERETTGTDGRARVELFAPKVVTPGDRLVFILSYRNTGAQPAANFVVTNPLPTAVEFLGSPDETALFSVDGGRSWGTLPTLKVRIDDARWREAQPEDVTHIRWTMARPVKPGSSGKLSFRGVVR